MQQLWNHQVVESVMDIHRNFWISSFLLSQMVLFENRKKNLEPYVLSCFSLDFLYGPEYQRCTLFLLHKKQRLQSPNLGTSKTCRNIAQFSRKAEESAYSAKHHPGSAEWGLRSLRFFAVELELIMWNKNKVHVPQGNHSLQMADDFWLQEGQTPKLWSCLILKHPRNMIMVLMVDFIVDTSSHCCRGWSIHRTNMNSSFPFI